MGDNDFPIKKADPVGYLQAYSSGLNRYQQEGPDIPTFGVQTDYAKQEGGPLVSQSFQIPVDIDDPSIDRLLEWKRQQPGYTPPQIPSGPELRERINNFRQRYSHLLSANQGPSSPVKYDENMGGFVPNQGAGRPANIRYKGFPAGA